VAAWGPLAEKRDARKRVSFLFGRAKPVTRRRASKKDQE